MTLLHADDHVRDIVLRPVLGRYGASQELSVGLELKADVGFDAAALAARVFSLARGAAQTDAFAGRVLPPGEWTDNARPGLTVIGARKAALKLRRACKRRIGPAARQ
ncbi:hypothetical protein [Caballeronia sp. GAOx1]|uniref:hypothetical protein n=1 Tax=Caballeronia sp. GAOx1 TaxID=2921761 RepID=UPI00202814D5|nr:hypothetical protein [Caballeronia sp. GAOx1]